MKRIAMIAALILSLPPAVLAQSEVVAQRGAVKLTVADVRAALEIAEPAMRAQTQSNPTALAEFVRERLLRQALLLEARASNIENDAALMARANDARDAVIVQSYISSKMPVEPKFPSQAELVAAYESNKARFVVPKQYLVAQIAILVPTGASKEVENEAKRKAQDVRQQALKPKADFAELARKTSQDQASAAKGGDLGWLREDQLQLGVRSAITALAENGVSDVVRGQDAWHVVKLNGVRPPSFLPLEQVSEGLALALRQNRMQQNVHAYVALLLQNEAIQLNEIELARYIAGAR